eukprot:gene19039-24860_t
MVLQNLSESEKLLLGVDCSMICSHSVRKGSATYTSILSIWQRIGWSLVAGLPHGSYEFGSLPPYFHPGFDYDWCEVVPCYDVLPLTFKRVVPFLVVFHNTWL